MIHAFRESKVVLGSTGAAGIPAAETAADDGLEIDMQGFNEGILAVYVDEAGTAGGALDGSNYWTLTVEHADESSVTPNTSGTYAVAAAEDLLFTAGAQQTAFEATAVGAFAVIDAATEDEQLYTVGYKGKKRYVRFYPRHTGSPGSTKFNAMWIKARSSSIPPA